MKVADLPDPVTAAKSDWLLATEWIGFTPTGKSYDAASMCQATIHRQFGTGFVLEYIAENIDKPNPGFEDDPQLVVERKRHAENKGRLVAVHRLRPSSRPLVEIIGVEGYERTQNLWARGVDRNRWSVAFPIVESFDIVGRPYANPIFGRAAYLRLFQHPSSTLRKLQQDERSALLHLEIVPRLVVNAWIAVEDEVEMAERSDIGLRILREIEKDLTSAMEGEPEDRKVKLRRRAAWLANRFVLRRRKEGSLRCDECDLDPAALPRMTGLNPRSLLDAHHMHPLDEGKRRTTEADFKLFCPTCHRLEHLLLKAATRVCGGTAG